MSHLNSRSVVAIAFALLFLAAPAQAHGDSNALQALDATISVAPGTDPVSDAAVAGLTFQNRTGNDWFQWRIDTAEADLVLDFHVEGDFGLERPRQFVPFLLIDDDSPGCEGPKPKGICDFRLFNPASNERVWEAQGDARIFHISGTVGDHALLVRIPGPVNATLVLQRDLEAPRFEIDEPREMTHYGFLRDTRTNELVTANTEVRRVGADEWISNPTPVFHHTQHFPIQGLAADTDHEVRTTFIDWAGNVATSDIVIIRSLPTPYTPAPVVTPNSPTPNMTLDSGAIPNISVMFETPESPLPGDGSGVLLFLDKKPIPEGFRIEVDDAGRTSGIITYAPASALEDGLHTARFEVTNVAGGTGAASWTFVVGQLVDGGEGPRQTPGPTILGGLAVMVGVAILLNRRGK